MKKLMTLGLILSAATCGAQSWTNNNEAPNNQPPVEAPEAFLGGLTTFTTLADLQNALSTSFTEDFSNTLIGPSDVGGCGPVINSTTASACFNAGAVIDGFNVNTEAAGDVVVLTVGFNGITSNAVGADTFTDVTQITFPGGDVQGVGFDAYIGFTPADLTISAFDASDALIGSYVVSGIGALPDSRFTGFTSPVPISRVTLQTAGDGGDLLSNLIFGGTQPLGPPPAVNALSTPATILLLLSMLVMGSVLVRRY
ncbi:hypothetical protein ACFODZ_01210 [Marinicella sediminis]|uniref:PEP-CTERM sorting domain-containing protein n=1 Tax=Marinicella sediminis TaxID=1792834 RepID=A0ABV7J6X7_9GAMM|nr:hypothetical protein [Marinicella sediminis]